MRDQQEDSLCPSIHPRHPVGDILASTLICLRTNNQMMKYYINELVFCCTPNGNGSPNLSCSLRGCDGAPCARGAAFLELDAKFVSGANNALMLASTSASTYPTMLCCKSDRNELLNLCSVLQTSACCVTCPGSQPTLLPAGMSDMLERKTPVTIFLFHWFCFHVTMVPVVT